jgi:hypothetical protein
MQMPSFTALGEKTKNNQTYLIYKNNWDGFFQSNKTLAGFIRWQGTVHVLTFWTCKLLTN